MDARTVRYPFEVGVRELRAHTDAYVDAVFSCLESEFLVLPRGEGFLDYPTFENAYEALKLATDGFRRLNADRVLPAAQSSPVALVVLRAMLGFSPPEWAYIASQRTGVEIPQGAARTLDRKARIAPRTPLRTTGVSGERLVALVTAACELLNEAAPEVASDRIHRLDKADTRQGHASIRDAAHMGMPYAMVLYERFLGRPFAGHRDSVSDLVGDSLESAIEEVLHRAGVSFRKTKRAEKIAGFEQAPDFIIPSEYQPAVVIEAKVTEDDGTARDKVARIQRLDELRREGAPKRAARYELVACVAGRGFGVRRADMRRMLLATEGKVFTMKTLSRLVACTRIREFASRTAE